MDRAKNFTLKTWSD